MTQNNVVDWLTILSNGFDLALRIVVDEEKSQLSLVHSDPGNWTSGRIGFGELRGSKYGISAASYPTVNIAALTYQDAAAIYRRDFATHVNFDALPTILATIMLDASINNGVSQAVKWLQQVVGTSVDGVYGPKTQAAVTAFIANDCANVLALCAQLSQLRLAMMTSLPDWHVNGGWSRRLAYLPFRAVAILTVPIIKSGGII